MKQIFTLLLGAVCLSTSALKAQNTISYAVEESKSTYTALMMPDTLVAPFHTEKMYSKSFNFRFKAFGKELDFSSPGSVMISSGFITVKRANMNDYVFIGPFVAELDAKDSFSAITTQVEGNTGSRILKIQWSNVALKGNPAKDYVNFQLWLHEADNSISIHGA